MSGNALRSSRQDQLIWGTSMAHYIAGVEVVLLWSDSGDPLFDPADSFAGVYVDASGQHYLRVDHWNGRRHVLRITSDEADQIISTNNHRLVFWTHLYGPIEAEDQGDNQKAEQLEASMKLKWEER